MGTNIMLVNQSYANKLLPPESKHFDHFKFNVKCHYFLDDIHFNRCRKTVHDKTIAFDVSLT